MQFRLQVDGFGLDVDRRGALCGIGRLAQIYPEMLMERDAAKYIRPYLEDNDESSRELSALALRMLGDKTD